MDIISGEWWTHYCSDWCCHLPVLLRHVLESEPMAVKTIIPISSSIFGPTWLTGRRAWLSAMQCKVFAGWYSTRCRFLVFGAPFRRSRRSETECHSHSLTIRGVSTPQFQKWWTNSSLYWVVTLTWKIQKCGPMNTGFCRHFGFTKSKVTAWCSAKFIPHDTRGGVTFCFLAPRFGVWGGVKRNAILTPGVSTLCFRNRETMVHYANKCFCVRRGVKWKPFLLLDYFKCIDTSVSWPTNCKFLLNDTWHSCNS